MMRRLPMLILLVMLPVAGSGACARQPMRDGPEIGANAPSPASAGCDATSTPSPPAFSAPPTTDSSFYAEQNRLDDMAAKVTSIAAHYPRVFAGVELAPDHSGIIVFRVPSAPFDDAVRAALPGDPVSIVDAPHSARELTTLLDRIWADRGYWTAHGVPLNWTSPQVDGSCVLVATSDPARAKPLFRLRYGAAPIQLIHGEAPVPL
jgi:hypothetical protein